MEWPHFYPENCPPTEAKPASGKVYRLVRNNPPKAEDFLSTWEEFPGRFPEPTIRISGASVYTDPQDVERLKKRIPQLNDRKTAKGELNSTLGFSDALTTPKGVCFCWFLTNYQTRLPRSIRAAFRFLVGNLNGMSSAER